MIFKFRLGQSARRKGDRFRDARDWPQAAAAYKIHLRTHPKDAAIWVQLGHAEKEQGRLKEAEADYRRAVGLTPDDPDVHLQLGHVLKLQERPDDATTAYRQSHRLEPSADAALEIHHLKPQTDAEAVVMSGRGIIFFSVQDLFVYLHAHPTMSGIQRVQTGIALHAMSDPTINAQFVLNDTYTLGRRDSFFLVDRDALRDIIAYASGARVDHAVLKSMLTEAEIGSHRVRPGRGSTMILLGAFWGLGISIDQYLAAKRDGVRVGAYIYDIIPITHPEYCISELVRDFSMSMAELAIIADFYLTISDYTGLSLKKFLQEHGLPTPPIETVPLAHSFSSDQGGGDMWPTSLRRIRGRRYVAYVSTIEGRKNHLYVINAWRQLMADGVDVPDLVFVGRRGWRIDALTDILETTKNLAGRVHIVHGLSDAEINTVYKNALFTVFTSFVEGWGLPVGESLAHHVPCVASRTSSIPEVGGALVDYVDPYNLRDGCATIRRMIEDERFRMNRRNIIVASFEPRHWNDVARDFVEKVKSFDSDELPCRPIEFQLPEGRLLRLTDLLPENVNIEDYMINPAKLMFSECFYNIENHGAWMRGAVGDIEFRTPCNQGDEIIVFLAVYPAPGYAGRLFSVEVGQTAPLEGGQIRHRPLVDGNDNLIRARGTVGPGGVVTVTLEIQGDVEQISERDKRKIGLGLGAIGFARVANITAREDLIEEFTFRDVSAR